MKNSMILKSMNLINQCQNIAASLRFSTFILISAVFFLSLSSCKVDSNAEADRLLSDSEKMSKAETAGGISGLSVADWSCVASIEKNSEKFLVVKMHSRTNPRSGALEKVLVTKKVTVRGTKLQPTTLIENARMLSVLAETVPGLRNDIIYREPTDASSPGGSEKIIAHFNTLGRTLDLDMDLKIPEIRFLQLSLNCSTGTIYTN
jgi:hypothetical protein